MLALTAGMFIGLHPNQNSKIILPVDAVDPIESYYSDISDTLTGNALRNALNTLNNKKRKRTVGYHGMKTFAAKCDADPNGSGKIVGFYDNKLLGPGWDGAATWNREHVWPNSRGGYLVEDDAHMTRPASTSINSERGSKGYSLKSYDPGQYVAYYRGMASRIILYAAIADTSLNLVEDPINTSQTGSYNMHMGCLSEMLAWNLEYLPSDTSFTGANDLARRTELNRNNVIQNHSDGQGNRNPFIDHPEYACRIWGNANAQTKKVCGLENITISKTSLTITEGHSSTIYATSKDSSEITWSTSNPAVATISSTSAASGSNITINAVAPGTCTLTAKATIDDTVYSATCSVKVVAIPVDTLTSISLSGNYPTEFTVGDTFSSEGLVVTANHSISGSQVVTDYSISSPDMSTEGEKTVEVSYSENEVTKTATYTIQVNARVIHPTSISLNKNEISLKVGETFQLVATVSPDDAGNKDVEWSPLRHDIAKVSTTGLVTAKAVGTVTVTATTIDGGLTANCVVTVTQGGGGGSSSGCGGSVEATSIILSTLSVLGIGLLLIKRKFSK